MVRNRKSNSMLTTTQVARLLNLHINTVRRWSNRGILKAYRLGPRGDRRYMMEDIEGFIERSEEMAETAVRNS